MNDGSVLTMGKLNVMMDMVKTIGRAPPAPRIIVSDRALEQTEDRLFPESRHRSRRVHKKLVKRHGGEYRMKPAIFRLSNEVWAVHPVLAAELRATTRRAPAGQLPFGLAFCW